MKAPKPLLSSLTHVLFFFLLSLLPGQKLSLAVHSATPPALVSDKNPPPPVSQSFYPTNFTSIKAPLINAESALVIDIDSAVLLFQKNPGRKLYPASLTKIMTALVALDNYALTSPITVNNISTPPQKIYLLPGEKITVENLLYATLVASGNDAAEALADAFPGGRSAFILQMNEKARSLHLVNTHFNNPTGFDDPNHYSTSLDLARLAIFAVSHPVISRIVATPAASIFSQDGKVEHKLTNINRLLGKVNGVKGVKTGYTQLAGEALITLTERSNHQILTVVMGSPDRFFESEQLIEWAFANHQWVNPLSVTQSSQTQPPEHIRQSPDLLQTRRQAA